MLKEELEKIEVRVPVAFNGKIEPQIVYLRGTGIEKVIDVFANYIKGIELPEACRRTIIRELEKERG